MKEKLTISKEITNSLEIKQAAKLKPLWTPSRYKVLYGGRGGAKSWGVARVLLLKAVETKLKILCTREIQNSIKDSVHTLLSEQIKNLGLERFYKIEQQTITCLTTGSTFIFAGIRQNTTKIKSYEGIDIVWVEEAATVTKASWAILIPTIRKPGSEIWLTFNPELDTDETYTRFVVNPPRGTIKIPINWRDNPWFPDVLKNEMLDLKETDPVGWENIWEGIPRSSVEGAIFADEIADAELKNRIKNVPYDQRYPVHTFWDLGYADNTAIWFIQKIDFDYRIIDFYQNRIKKLAFYMNMLQTKGYLYGTHHLPHDGAHETLGADSIETQMRRIGMNVFVVPRGGLLAGIELTRAILSQCYFDKELTFDGIQGCRRYRWGEGRTIVHDVNSHPADALRTFATTKYVQWDAFSSLFSGSSMGNSSIGKLLSEYDPLEDKMSESGMTVYSNN